MKSKPEAVKIVLVEDDPGHAELIQHNLKQGGITNDIVHFDNGKTAVEALLNKDSGLRPGYLVVLLDLNLPGMDGYQVLKALRASEYTRHTPISILTTTADKREIEKCYTLGCNTYITKPVEYNDFQDAMKKLGILLSLVKFPETR